MWLNKKYFYDSSLTLYLDNNYFNLQPHCYPDFENVFGVLFDISSTEFKGDKLSIKIIKEESTILTLKKTNSKNIEEEIIKIYFEKSDIYLSNDEESSSDEPPSSNNEESSKKEPPSFNDEESSKKEPPSSIGEESSIEEPPSKRFKASFSEIEIKEEPVTEEEFQSIHRIVNVSGECTFVANTKFIEATYEIDDTHFDEYSFITNPETNIYTAINRIFADGIYSSFGLYQNCCLLDTSVTFSQCEGTGPVVIDVSQKCLAVTVTEPQTTVVVPWIDNSVILARRLATVLNIDGGGIRFFDDNNILVDESLELDVDKFLLQDTDNPRIYYNVYDLKVKCTSLLEDGHSFELTIPTDCTVSDLKRRLQGKMKIEFNRFVLCQNNKRLRNDKIISDKEEVEYFVTAILENIASKELIGEGGFGQIYKCTSSSSQETIVLKKFTAILNEEREWKSFIGELRAMLHLSQKCPHRHILKYLDLYLDDDDVCIGMEFVSRGSLRNYLNVTGPLGEREIKIFSLGIIKGVEYLHENRIIHRDIKGDNVLLGEEDIVKLCDFGLATILTDFTLSDLSNGIVQSRICGSFRWMAPEVILGEKCGLKADIWSIGATVVEMITGKVPYPELDHMQAALKIGSEKQIDFISINPISAELRHFVNCCLTANVKDRPKAQTLLSFEFIKEAL